MPDLKAVDLPLAVLVDERRREARPVGTVRVPGYGAERDRGRVPLDPGRRPAGKFYALQRRELVRHVLAEFQLLLIPRRQIIPTVLIVGAGGRLVEVPYRLRGGLL